MFTEGQDAKAGEARADLRRQQANLTTAELNLGYTEIKAPIDGRIGRCNFSAGNFVGPQCGTLATIVSQDPDHGRIRARRPLCRNERAGAG